MSAWNRPDIGRMLEDRDYDSLWALLEDDQYRLALEETTADRYAEVIVGWNGDVVGRLLAVCDRTDDPYVRQRSAEALGRLKDQRAVSALTSLLKDDYRRVREASATALTSLAWDPAGDDAGVYYWAVRGEWEKCVDAGEIALEPLAAITLHEWNRELEIGWSPTDRETSALSIARIGSPSAIQHLIQGLRTGSTENQKFCAAALAQMRGEATRDVIFAMRDKTADRAGWLYLVPQILEGDSDERALVFLLRLLWHESLWVRANAAVALGKRGSKEAAPALIARLWDKSVRVRWLAAQSLDRLGWTSGTNSQQVAYCVAREKWQECADMGSAATADLVAHLKSVGWADEREFARMQLDSENESTTDGIIRALGAIADQQAIEGIKPALLHRSAFIRKSAADALRRCGWKPDESAYAVAFWAATEDWDKCRSAGLEAIVPLIVALRTTDGESRGKIVTILSEGGSSVVLALEHSLLFDDNWGAAVALAQLHLPQAKESLAVALYSADEMVRRNARGYLKRLGEDLPTGTLDLIEAMEKDFVPLS